jgi:D-alanyl-lipoteichoic acid acyltransferase DltB (MBOAT superfamily)
VSVPSFAFLAFSLILIGLFHIRSTKRWQQGILLAGNIAFITSFAESPAAILPYAGFLLLGGVGVAARRSLGSWSVWVFPLLVLIMFAWLKRYLFVPKELLLPEGYLLIGLSYVFFRVMHLVIDGWETMPLGGNGWISYLNYTLNFTSLISGPIQRYDDYQRSEQSIKRLTRGDSWLAIERVIKGFFKVYIVSVLLNMGHQSLIEAFATEDGASKILSAAALTAIYPIYLYFNFSGYTDFVIGVARFLNIELPENFDHPFTAGNFITFWSRWHMSLSNWLKTYVYNTTMLTLMRRTRSPQLEPFIAVAAYFLTFFLVGLWHGQTSEFVLFGVLQGGGVAANKLYQIAMTRRLGRARYNELTKSVMYAMLSRGLTFTWFAFTLLWFWSSWDQIEGFTQSMRPGSVTLALALILASATVGLELLDRFSASIRGCTVWGDSLADSCYVRLTLVLGMFIALAFAALSLNAPPSQVVYQVF